MNRSRLVHVHVLALASGFALLAAFDAPSAWAYCPSYGTAAGCAVEPTPGANPTDAVLRTFFDKVGTGSFTAQDGPSVLPMSVGCNIPTPSTKQPPRFPCHVLFALSQQESAWTHFCVPQTPRSAVGKPERTIVSFDCGYGIAQVTSGMRGSNTPTVDQSRVASDPLYNLVVGAGILREKWQIVQCVGDRNPDVVEDWYSALWAYNGLAYQNNPNNPTFSAGRKPYDPQNGGSYPYQEKILGWMEHPKVGRWPAILPAYPNRGEVGTTGTPKAVTEPKCGSPTSCASTRTTNLSPCTPPPSPLADAGPAPPPVALQAGLTVEVEVEVEEQVETAGACLCSYAGRSSRQRHDAALVAAGLLAASVVVRRRARVDSSPSA